MNQANQYASTVGGGAMTMVVRRNRAETAKPAQEENPEPAVRPAEAAVIIRRAPAARRRAA